VVLTRTWSDTEAELIVGLLQAHGLFAWTASDVPHSVLPLTVNGLGEVRILVNSDDVEDAATLLAEYSGDLELENGAGN
jgi:hypothetical protein